MIYTFIIGWLIWITGVFAAWNQLSSWSMKGAISVTEYDPVMVLLSLLSWFIYPLYGMAWIFNRLKKR